MALICIQGTDLCTGCAHCQYSGDCLCSVCGKKIKEGDGYFESEGEILCLKCAIHITEGYYTQCGSFTDGGISVFDELLCAGCAKARLIRHNYL